MKRFCSYCGISFLKGYGEYCSVHCMHSAGNPNALKSEELILCMVADLERKKAVNPSEVAQLLVNGNSSLSWRSAMKEVMHAARRLVRQGKLEIIRKGKPVNPDEVRGVVRLRRRSVQS